MATCNCNPGCNCNTPTEPTLDFSVFEMNQILADGIINASTRYAKLDPCNSCQIYTLTISEAIGLVPIKDRSTCRILVFLNKSEEPEMWIWGGKTMLDWVDITKWKQIPTDSTMDNVLKELSTIIKNLASETKAREEADKDIIERIEVLEGRPETNPNLVLEKLEEEIKNRITADNHLSKYFVKLIQDNSEIYQDALNAEKEARRKEDDRLEQWIKKLDPNDIGKLNFITSDSIRGIESVTEAPMVEDDVLYLEFGSLNGPSKYTQTLEFAKTPVPNTPVDVTYKVGTRILGSSGVEKARSRVEVTYYPVEGASVAFLTKTTPPISFSGSGNLDSEPFKLAPDDTRELPLEITFSHVGQYNLRLTLFDDTTKETLSTINFNIKVPQP